MWQVEEDLYYTIPYNTRKFNPQVSSFRISSLHCIQYYTVRYILLWLWLTLYSLPRQHVSPTASSHFWDCSWWEFYSATLPKVCWGSEHWEPVATISSWAPMSFLKSCFFTVPTYRSSLHLRRNGTRRNTTGIRWNGREMGQAKFACCRVR